MKNKTKKIFINIFIFIFLFITVLPVKPVKAVTQPETPIINKILPNNLYNKKKFVYGLTPENTEVLIYLDKKYIGTATTKKECKNGWCDFYYNKKVDIPEGEHSLFFIAKNKTSLVLSSPTKNFTIITKKIPAPTLVGIVKNNILTGLTVSGTKVEVYIDGKYNGETDFLYHKSGTANFAYRFTNIKPGKHIIYVKAVDKNKQKSEVSKKMDLFVPFPYPAPVLLSKRIKINPNNKEVSVEGVVKSNSFVDVYVDNRFIKRVGPFVDLSGAVGFIFKIPNLTEGKHSIYTIAIDCDTKKQSKKSNIIEFLIRKSKPRISKAAASEVNKDVVKNNKKDKVVVKGVEFQKIKKEKQENIKEEDSTNKEEIFIPEPSKNKTKGLINEKKQNQNTLNVIIFVLFLVIIISWIFWVNRELIKEKNKNKNKST